MPYVVPVIIGYPGTVLAVNVGGAVVPFFLSAFLIIKHRLYMVSVVGVALVAFAVHGGDEWTHNTEGLDRPFKGMALT